MNPGNNEFLLYEMAPILCRLPVKSVVRFRSLATNLQSLIDSPGFVYMYFQSSLSRCRIFLLLFRRHLTALPHGGSCRLSYPLQQPRWISTDIGPVATAGWDVNTKLVGSYQGIVCIAFSPFDVCLWNPSTRTHKHLPFHPFAYENPSCRRVRFGFGPFGGQGDYMVIRIVKSYSLQGGSVFRQLSAYRLSTNTWESVEDKAWTCTYFLDNDLWEPSQTRWEFGEAGVYSHGAVHWMVHSRLSFPIPYEIIMYELGTPIGFYKENVTSTILGQRGYESVLNMSLSSMNEKLFLTCQFREESNVAEIWKQENYLDETSWSRILVVHRYVERLKPVLIAGDGKKILLRMDSSLVWYNLENGRRIGEWEILPHNGPDLLSDATDLFECLAPVPGGQGNCEEP